MQVELTLARCDDGQMHGFVMLDDGVSVAPLCGKTVARKDAGEDSSPTCPVCLPRLAQEFGIPISAFRSRQL